MTETAPTDSRHCVAALILIPKCEGLSDELALQARGEMPDILTDLGQNLTLLVFVESRRAMQASREPACYLPVARRGSLDAPLEESTRLPCRRLF
jgi:hypothetical protein